MKLFYFIYNHVPFLDLIYEPNITYSLSKDAAPETKLIAVGVLVLFLAFIGYLIWNSSRKKDD